MKIEIEIEMFQASLKNITMHAEHVLVVCTIYPPDTFQINNNNRYRRTSGQTDSAKTIIQNW